jgi:hypothetical protein
MTENVCPHFRAPRRIRSTLTSHYDQPTRSCAHQLRNAGVRRALKRL